MSAVVDRALMLLLGVAMGGRAPLGSILHPALWGAHREAAFAPALIRGAVGIEKGLAITSGFEKKIISHRDKPNQTPLLFLHLRERGGSCQSVY